MKVTLAFSDSGGVGLPLVLLHGFPFDRRSWHTQVVALRETCRVICPDLRGHGASPVGPPPARMEDMAGDVAALLDRLGIAAAAIGGLSMGGYVALAFVRLFPKRVRALVLADTRAGADSPEGRKTRHDTIALVRAEGARAIADRMLPRLLAPSAPQSARDLVRRMIESTPVEGIVGALLGMAERPDSTDFLAKIACPTLVMCGGEDVITPLAESRAMVEKIPGATLVTIPGVGHVSNLEAPDVFNSALVDFLARA